MLNLKGSTVPMACAALLAAAVVARADAPAAGGPGALDAPSRSARLEARGITLTGGTVLDEASSAGASAGTDRRDDGGKNPMVALLLSAAIPGWGEMYAGHPARGRAFMAAEAAIWTAYAGYTVQTGMREDDYREFAEVFAGVPDGAPGGYYEDIADYERSEGYDSYNESVRDDARSLFPDDPAAQDAYFAENGYFGDEAWEWESDARFRQYRHLRHLAGESDRRAFYMTGLAVLNRAVSAIDSAWLARRTRPDGGAGARASLSVTPDLADDGRVGARAALSVRF